MKKTKPPMASPIFASGTSRFNVSPKPNLSSSVLRRKAFYEGGHQLEKLEFALAIAESRGDETRSAVLRAQIADLGGNIEEPGT